MDSDLPSTWRVSLAVKVSEAGTPSASVQNDGVNGFVLLVLAGVASQYSPAAAGSAMAAARHDARSISRTRTLLPQQSECGHLSRDKMPS